MLISIDHGNYSLKSVNCEPIKAGVVESDVRPFGNDILKYKGKYYQLSEQRIPYRRDKTEDERYFILTLFAIAHEIEAANAYFPGTIPIQLAVGLPPAHFGAQSKPFIKYFSDRGIINFSYRGRQYSVSINDVACYPQSYAAAMTLYRELANVPKALVLDIGGYTVDYILIKNGAGDMTICDSLENGIITLYNKVISRARSELDILLTEAEIDAILARNDLETPIEIVTLTERMAQEFISDLLNTLRERQLEMKSGRIIFVGGGALLLSEQIQKSGKVPKPIFVENIKANARGYELLYKQMHRGGVIQ